jgi:hypothetical protein
MKGICDVPDADVHSTQEFHSVPSFLTVAQCCCVR